MGARDTWGRGGEADIGRRGERSVKVTLGLLGWVKALLRLTRVGIMVQLGLGRLLLRVRVGRNRRGRVRDETGRLVVVVLAFVGLLRWEKDSGPLYMGQLV